MTQLDLLFLIASPFVGSFIYLWVVRTRMGAAVGGIVWGRSHCPQCGNRLSIRDLIPIVSWVVQRARCRSCQHRLSNFYPAAEVCALGLTLSALFILPSGPLFWLSCFLGWILLALSLKDIDERRLPDVLTLPLMGIGLAATYQLNPAAIPDHLTAALFTLVGLFALRWTISRWRGREALGLGDVKLAIAMALWLGAMGLISALFIASITGLCGVGMAKFLRRSDYDQSLPFGPYLCIGFWCVWLFGPLEFAPMF